MRRTIRHGAEHMELHETGAITRPAIGMNTASNNWIVTGAVTRNNFGHVTRRYSLADILSNPGAIPWQHGNGEQKTFIQDIDHGTPREWRNPTHSVI